MTRGLSSPLLGGFSVVVVDPVRIVRRTGTSAGLCLERHGPRLGGLRRGRDRSGGSLRGRAPLGAGLDLGVGRRGAGLVIRLASLGGCGFGTGGGPGLGVGAGLGTGRHPTRALLNDVTHLPQIAVQARDVAQLRVAQVDRREVRAGERPELGGGGDGAIGAVVLDRADLDLERPRHELALLLRVRLLALRVGERAPLGVTLVRGVAGGRGKVRSGPARDVGLDQIVVHLARPGRPLADHLAVRGVCPLAGGVVGRRGLDLARGLDRLLGLGALPVGLLVAVAGLLAGVVVFGVRDVRAEDGVVDDAERRQEGGESETGHQDAAQHVILLDRWGCARYTTPFWIGMAAVGSPVLKSALYRWTLESKILPGLSSLGFLPSRVHRCRARFSN